MDDDTSTGPLADLRAAFLSASQASMDATVDAAAIRGEPATPDRDDRLVAALHRMVELQTSTLIALDRVVARAAALGVDWRVIAEFREGRVDLAMGLHRTQEHLRRIDQRL